MIKKHLNSIYRIEPTKHKKGETRLHMGERSCHFPFDLEEVIKNISMEDINLYPDYEETKRKIINIFNKKNHSNLNSTNLLLTNGSDGGIKSVFECTLVPKDNVLFPSSSYPMYRIYTEIAEANSVEIPYPSNLVISESSLTSVLKAKKFKLCIITNPSRFGQNYLGDFIEDLCKQFPDTIFLIDEAYREYQNKNYINYQRLISTFQNVIFSRTFSKAWGLAGLRIGYLLGNSRTIDLISRSQSSYPVSSVSCKILEHCLDNYKTVDETIELVRKERDELYSYFSRLQYVVSLSCYPSDIMIEQTQDLKDWFETNNITVKTGVNLPENPTYKFILLTVQPFLCDSLRELEPPKNTNRYP